MFPNQLASRHSTPRISIGHSAASLSFSPLRFHSVLITTKGEIISNSLIRHIHRLFFADFFQVISTAFTFSCVVTKLISNHTTNPTMETNWKLRSHLIGWKQLTAICYQGNAKLLCLKNCMTLWFFNHKKTLLYLMPNYCLNQDLFFLIS